MSHEPTEEEWNAFFEYHTIPYEGLTAANSLRDRRIRNEALEEATRTLEKFGYENGRQECCGRGVPDRIGCAEECCGVPDWIVRLDLAADIIRALKDKEPTR